MNKRPWSFQSNPFETHTRGSNRKMFTIASDTRSKLNAEIADADILAMFNNFDPVFQAYVLIYTNYSVIFGQRKGKTLNLKNLLTQLREIHLPKWEGLIHAQYPKGTPEEVELFPNSRIPFSNGTYEERINAVKVLHEKVAPVPALAAVTPLVLSMYNLLITARDTQQQKEGLKGQLSASRESQRVLLADELYKVLAGMMVKFYNERAQISHYFDLALLRAKGEQDETILKTYEFTLGLSELKDFGPWVEGTVAMRMTVISGQARGSRGIDGDVIDGVPIVLLAPGTETKAAEDFQVNGMHVVVENLSAMEVAVVKVELLG